jgi:hypothetical protein
LVFAFVLASFWIWGVDNNTPEVSPARVGGK